MATKLVAPALENRFEFVALLNVDKITRARQGALI